MLTCIVALGLLLRLCVTLHSHSGQSTPPMFGDFEAQRHWMEVTYNLPTKDWYFNSSENDLMYWGLDYPPLTAYHSWLCGYVASTINTSFVQLKESRGLESENIKFFMRCTVLIADLLTYIPSILIFYLQNKNISIYNSKECSSNYSEINKLCCLFALLYPGIIIIDHGHFQYNCVSLGFFIFAVAAICQEKHIAASMLFTFSLLYKQMELYHALPFFFYLLGICISIFKKSGFIQAITKLTHIGCAVILTIVIVCFPFITSLDQSFQLLVRLFPIARGVFEDKVANIWCVVNIVYKLKLFISNEAMAKACLLLTSIAVIPSLYDVFLNNSPVKFKFSLINCALAFFLFSFQVHEKTILLVAVPVLLVMPFESLACVWFLIISVFSMFPLILKDRLLLPYVALSIIFGLAFEYSPLKKLNEDGKFTKNYHFQSLKRHIPITLFYYTSLLGCVILTIGACVITPPKRYPDLFSLLISVYSCLHFLGFFVYFNVKQWTLRDGRGKLE